MICEGMKQKIVQTFSKGKKIEQCRQPMFGGPCQNLSYDRIFDSHLLPSRMYFQPAWLVILKENVHLSESVCRAFKFGGVQRGEPAWKSCALFMDELVTGDTG